MARLISYLGTALVLAAPCLVLAEEMPVAPPSSGGLLRQIDEGFIAVFEKVAPGVVVIESSKSGSSESADAANEPFDFFRSPDAPPRNDPHRQVPGFRLPEPSNRSEGSGFILRKDGYIVTNYHVVEGASQITVRLRDGRKLDARLVGADEHTDIAVVRVEAEGLIALPLADSSSVRVGQLVCAIGAPFKLDYSFSIGCVSGLGRTGLSALTYENYIQTDAFINPGNSGGPLFDVDGNVLGMNTLINGIGRGLAFAIPSNMVRDVASQLITDGRVRRPALGIRIESLTDESSLRGQIKGVEKGVVVNTIEPDSAAYRSDLRPMDVITAIDGQPVATAHELQSAVLRTKVGQTVQLTVSRHGKEMTIPITTSELGAKQTAGVVSRVLEREYEGILEEEGLHGLTLGEAPAERLKATKEKAAVLIKEVAPNSPAEEAQLLVDDLILEIDGKAVTSPDEATIALSKKRASYLLIVERKGQKTYAILKAAE